MIQTHEAVIERDGTVRLLEDEASRVTMRADLAEVAHKLSGARDPIETAADWIEKVWSEETVQAG